MMSLSDLNFLFRLLPGSLLLFYLVPPAFRRLCLLCASLVFYALTDLRYLPLLICAALVNHAAGRLVVQKNRAAFTLIVLADALLLCGLKFAGAFSGSLLLPVGLSFFTFKMIRYQADMYRGKISPSPSLFDTLLYISFFAQILSGPIMCYEDYGRSQAFSLSALKSPAQHRKDTFGRIEEGAFYLCAGLAFKVLIADHLSMCWHQIGTIGYAHLSTPLAWIGVVCYSLNLYFDFWGYSLMAAGIGVAFGFPFIENFRHPYAAANVTAFYRRWHITLGAFFRDVVYVPLKGSRAGALRTIRNLLLVWLMTALWHGVGVTFLIWGMCLFVLIVLEKFLHPKLPAFLRALLGRFHVLVLVPLTWIPFATGRLSYLTGYLHRLFPFAGVPANVYAGDYVAIVKDYAPYFAAGLIFLLPQAFSFFEKRRTNPVCALLLLALFWLSVYSLAGQSANPFLYLRF